ncbi:hypothetical protein FJZ26_02470 [Candidatus Parvarchaeota archaeon]|nr:hypothetical protein [Candidatus Parvarchaeota archaeon]
MSRGKRIIIEKKIKDPVVAKVKSIKISDLKKNRHTHEKSLSSSIGSIVGQAQTLYEEDKLEKEMLKGMGLYTLEEAHEELKRGGVNISFRAFGGRVERRTVMSAKVGKKRLIPKPVIHDWIALKNEYYTMKEAFTELKKHEDINFRAFIGRVEKNSIPSLKIGTQRWVPKASIDGLAHIASNYYVVGEAVEMMEEKGVKIKRNAFERRLDRSRIPFEKVGGRRMIAHEVLDELIAKELALRSQ